MCVRVFLPLSVISIVMLSDRDGVSSYVAFYGANVCQVSCIDLFWFGVPFTWNIKKGVENVHIPFGYPFNTAFQRSTYPTIVIVFPC